MILEYKGYKSTRFILVSVGVILSSVFLITTHISGQEWVDSAIYLIGGYAFSEVGAKAAQAYKDKS